MSIERRVASRYLEKQGFNRTPKVLEELSKVAMATNGLNALMGERRKPKHFRHHHKALKGYGSEDYDLFILTVYQRTKSDNKKKIDLFMASDSDTLMVVDRGSQGNSFDKPQEVSPSQAKKIIRGMALKSKVDPAFLVFLDKEGVSYEVVGVDKVHIYPETVDFIREDWEYDEQGGEDWYESEMYKRVKKLMKKVKNSFPSTQFGTILSNMFIVKF